MGGTRLWRFSPIRILPTYLLELGGPGNLLLDESKTAGGAEETVSLLLPHEDLAVGGEAQDAEGARLTGVPVPADLRPRGAIGELRKSRGSWTTALPRPYLIHGVGVCIVGHARPPDQGVFLLAGVPNQDLSAEQAS